MEINWKLITTHWFIRTHLSVQTWT